MGMITMSDLTMKEFDQYFEEAHEYWTLADSGEIIDQMGLQNFLAQAFKFVNNPENEDKIQKIIVLLRDNNI